METYHEKLGKTTIDPGVLTNIAKLTSLSASGVSKMATGPHSVGSLFKKNYSDGVKIEVENNTVYIELYLVLKSNADLLKTSRTVQQKVSRAITEMVGMEIGHVNVHIEDIDYQNE
ncbi:MAG: Asp23/Gls24 family envelope stress response protein [Pelolinea sp.]|nr:Asp23/Gls24 family envelope stress response protein [Pelolinea sp.]